MIVVNLSASWLKENTVPERTRAHGRGAPVRFLGKITAMAANWAGEIAQLASTPVNPQNAMEVLAKTVAAMKGMAEQVVKSAASTENMRVNAEGNWQKMIKAVEETKAEMNALKTRIDTLEAGKGKGGERKKSRFWRAKRCWESRP